MSLLRTRRPPQLQRSASATWDAWVRMVLGPQSGAPSVSSVAEALRHAATWACISIKAKGIAACPVDVVRYEGDNRIPMTLPPVIANPSALTTRRVWTHQVAWSMFTDGNAFGLVVAEQRGLPSQIELVNPVDVTARDVVNGQLRASVQGKVQEAWPLGRLWHVAGEMTVPGTPFGLSPVEFASRSIGTALSAQSFGGGFFSEGGIPAAILSPTIDPGREGAQALKDRWMEATRGSREPMVLPQSTKYERISVDPNDSQFIELMRFEVEEVCRFFGVPPSMVYGAVSGQSVTYANVSQADLHYLKHTLSYPIDLVEDALSDLLPKPRVVRFNRDAILRADTTTRYQDHEIALRNRWRTVNEVRALEDEPPLRGKEFNQPGVPPMTAPEPPAPPDAPMPDMPDQGGAT